MEAQINIQSQKELKCKISKKTLINLFPKQSDCSYVSCYCEENVYKLCEDVKTQHSNEVEKCSVIFVSNSGRLVPLWRQRAGKEDDKLVIWDYHVIFMYQPDEDKCLIFDLDSELPFPTYFHKYVTETFRTDHILKPEYFRYLRIIPARQYLEEFASDRRHMKRPDGSWIKTPPSYAPIIKDGQQHNLEDYINMDLINGPGRVMNLSQFINHYYKPST